MKSKKTGIRMIANLLVLVLVFSCMTFAANAVETRSSDCISSYAGGAMWSGSNILVSFNIVARETMTTLGAPTIVIQKWTSNGWTPAKTYYSSSTSGMTSSNTAFHSGSVTYYNAPAGTYRAKISFYAANSSKSDSKLFYTSAI